MSDTMRLRCLVGAYAGQVLTYPRHIGEHLLSFGQAERVDDDVPPRAPERTVVPAPPVASPAEPEGADASQAQVSETPKAPTRRTGGARKVQVRRPKSRGG